MRCARANYSQKTEEFCHVTPLAKGFQGYSKPRNRLA
jgi:hypothetical protein